MKKQELYVSLETNEYKKSKTDILNSQADLLNMMKYLENLKQIKQEKINLKIKLHTIFTQLIENLKNFEENLPTPKVPKSIQDKQKQTQETNPEQPFSRYEEIEGELREIQEKLKTLNS